jgi:hypothetical protein
MSEFPKASMRAPARTQQTRLVAVLVLLYTTALAGGGCRAPRVASKPPAPPYHPWRLTALDYPHHHGAYLGNGFMGMRIGAEGFGCHHGEPQMCLLAGAYGNEHLVQAPRWSYAAFSNGRAWFPADPSRPFETQQIPGFAPSSAPPEGTLPELSEYRQTLDMKGGVIQTHYKWRERRRTLTFDITCFVNRAGNRNLAAIQWRITPGYNGEMQYFLPLGVAQQPDTNL